MSAYQLTLLQTPLCKEAVETSEGPVDLMKRRRIRWFEGRMAMDENEILEDFRGG